MRIGFDAKRAFNNQRGLGNYSRDTIRILTSLAPDHEYHLFTPKTDPKVGFTAPDGALMQLPKDANGEVAQSFWRTFKIAKEAERLGIDVYHGLSHELPYGIEDTKVRTVVTMHDLLFLKQPQLYPTLDRLLYRTKYLHSCRVADRIVAVSEQTKRDLLELTDTPESKITVVYQGCRPEFKTLVSETAKKEVRARYGLPEEYLLNVGAFDPRKNQLLLLKALKAGHLDFPLVIAGQSTDYLKKLQRYTAKNGLGQQVKFLPDFPMTDLPALYQGATLFVFPSTYEGFGIPVVEALTSGVPVIAATGSCLEESGGPDSLYASPDDEAEWAVRINELLSNDQQRGTMIAKGLSYAQRFSDPVIAENLIRIYKSLIP